MTVFNPDTDTMTHRSKNGETRQVSMKDTYQYVNPHTGKTETVPVGISPGFNYAKGLGGTQTVNEAVQAKVSTLPATLQTMVKADFANGGQ